MSAIEEIQRPSAYARFIRVIVQSFQGENLTPGNDINDYRFQASRRAVSDHELRMLAISLVELAASSGKTITINIEANLEHGPSNHNAIVVIHPDYNATCEAMAKIEQRKTVAEVAKESGMDEEVITFLMSGIYTEEK